VTVALEVIGKGHVADLIAALAELPGVTAVTAGDGNEDAE
jgi:hypothetical protein